jgi:DNA polymerase-3 subunit epsilon
MARDSTAARGYLEAPLPDPATPWREATFSVVDVELTGLDPGTDEIISFASVTVREGRIRLDDARHLLIRPRRMPPAESIRVHGLRELDLADAPPLAEALDEILAALTGSALVAHAAAVDVSFLRAALEAHGLKLRNPVIDTAALARELGRRRRRAVPPAARGAGFAVSSPGLSELARWLGLPAHRPHHADGDALTAAQAFLALATHLDELEPRTVGSLELISRAPSRRSRWRLLRRSGKL